MAWQWFTLSAGVLALVLLILSLVMHSSALSSPIVQQVRFAIWGDVIATVSVLAYLCTRLAEDVGYPIPIYISLLALFMGFAGLAISASRAPISGHPERDSWLSGFLQGICVAFALIIAVMVVTYIS